MKILTVLGARPQFIKAAIVSKAIRSQAGYTEVIVHTGQHFDANMSSIFFDELGIPEPNYTLDIHSLGHGAMTGRMLEAVEQTLIKEAPDWVLVYGDTNSTIAGALAAAKLQIPVAHVEAGLRSFNRRMPEEINRIATDHISDLLFVPTETARTNLIREGIDEKKLVLTGDVMYDCALTFGEMARQQSSILEDLNLAPGSFALCTVHRAENTGSVALLNTLHTTLTGLAKTIPVVLPLHPRTRDISRNAGIALEEIPGVVSIDPVGYLDMVRLEQAAALIMTDSGGVQKEAYFHSVPCITLRPETEWVELVETGWTTLCPLENGADKLLKTALDRLGSKGKSIQLYGQGNAAQQIIGTIASHSN